MTLLRFPTNHAALGFLELTVKNNDFAFDVKQSGPECSFDWHLPKNSQSDNDTDEESDVMLADPEVKRPPMYAVVLHNDDYTPMEFVIEVLQTYFGHSVERATEIMLNVHYQGKGIAGVYPRDIAETKAQQVNKQARIAGHPLLCQIEPQSSSD